MMQSEVEGDLLPLPERECGGDGCLPDDQAVCGQDDFRREVWLEAGTAGLQVRGYKPSERDQQELERRLAGRDANSVAPLRDRGLAQDADLSKYVL